MSETTKNIRVFAAIGIIILFMFLWQEQKEKNLAENQVTTIGVITAIEYCGSNIKKCIEFSYLVDNEWVKGSDPLSASYPDYVRRGKPVVGRSYKVVYDSKNPEFSKIIILPKPLSEEQKKRFSSFSYE